MSLTLMWSMIRCKHMEHYVVAFQDFHSLKAFPYVAVLTFAGFRYPASDYPDWYQPIINEPYTTAGPATLPSITQPPPTAVSTLDGIIITEGPSPTDETFSALITATFGPWEPVDCQAVENPRYYLSAMICSCNDGHTYSTMPGGNCGFTTSPGPVLTTMPIVTPSPTPYDPPLPPATGCLTWLFGTVCATTSINTYG